MGAVLATQTHQGAIGIEQGLAVAVVSLLQGLQVLPQVLVGQAQQRQGACTRVFAVAAVFPLGMVANVLLHHLRHGGNQVCRTGQLHALQRLSHLGQDMLRLDHVGLGMGGEQALHFVQHGQHRRQYQLAGIESGRIQVGHGVDKDSDKLPRSALVANRGKV